MRLSGNAHMALSQGAYVWLSAKAHQRTSACGSQPTRMWLSAKAHVALSQRACGSQPRRRPPPDIGHTYADRGQETRRMWGSQPRRRRYRKALSQGACGPRPRRMRLSAKAHEALSHGAWRMWLSNKARMRLNLGAGSSRLRFSIRHRKWADYGIASLQFGCSV